MSVVTFAQPYPEYMAVMVSSILTILSIIFIIVGIILFRSGNAEIRARKAKVEREIQAKINLDKDMQIKLLEKRLKRIEKMVIRPQNNSDESIQKLERNIREA